MVQDTPDLQPEQPAQEAGDYTHAYDLALDYLERPQDLTIPTGFQTLDKHLGGGLIPKSLYIIGGRVGEGKTSCALSIARRIAFDQHQPVLFLSLEMTKQELIERTICQFTLTPITQLKELRESNELKEKLKPFFQVAKQSRFQLEDSRGATVEEIRRLLAEMAHVGEPSPKVLVIDHLQHIPFKGPASSVDAITFYLAELKVLAKEQDIAIIVCSQLNRNVYETKDKHGNVHPQLPHLRGSGGIEQVSDCVLLGYRLNMDERLDVATQSQDTEYEIFIAKHRRGPQVKISMVFRPPCFEFFEPGGTWVPRRMDEQTVFIDAPADEVRVKE